MKKINMLVVLLNFITIARAQVINIKSNDKSVRYDLIKPVHDFDKVMSFDLTGRLTSEFINENLVKVDSVRHYISFIRSRQIPMGHIYTDTSVTSTSGPISYHETSNSQAYEVKATFRLNSVQAQGNRKGTITNKTTQISAGYFDDNTIENMIGILSIKRGIRYHLECYRFESKAEINPFDVEYVMDDFTTDHKGLLTPCEVIYFKHGFAYGYVWVDKETRQSLKETIFYPDHYSVITAV